MHNIHDIKSTLVKMHLYFKCNVKEGTRNTNYEIVNQHKNDTCYVQSLEKNFYLGALSSFDHVFTPL
jgi:hypothetical protein